MMKILAIYGLHCQIVSDNGAQFTLFHFTEFLKQNGIKHIHSAPYHSATNGEAERFIQTFKHAMKAAKYDSGTFETNLYSCIGIHPILPPPNLLLSYYFIEPCKHD